MCWSWAAALASCAGGRSEQRSRGESGRAVERGRWRVAAALCLARLPFGSRFFALSLVELPPAEAWAKFKKFTPPLRFFIRVVACIH